MVVVRILRSIPPNGVLGGLVHNDVFVLRRTSSVDTSHNVHGSEFSYLSFLVSGKVRPCLFVEENLISRVVEDLLDPLDSVLA